MDGWSGWIPLRLLWLVIISWSWWFTSPKIQTKCCTIDSEEVLIRKCQRIPEAFKPGWARPKFPNLFRSLFRNSWVAAIIDEKEIALAPVQNKGVCRKCELSRFDKSSSFANPSGFCILKISKEWLHSKKSCITQKFHPLVTNKYIERQTVVHLTHYHSLTHSDENNIQQFHPPSSFPTFPMISWHSSTSTITYFMALGIATEAQYLSKSPFFQRYKIFSGLHNSGQKN